MGWIKLSINLILICKIKCLAIHSENELQNLEKYRLKLSLLFQFPRYKPMIPASWYNQGLIFDNAWEESRYFEGDASFDMLFNKLERLIDQQNVIGQGAGSSSRNGYKDVSQRWPNGVVIYKINHKHFSSEQVNAIKAAMATISEVSCVKFRRYRKGDPGAINITGNLPGCSAHIGYQGGFQNFNLNNKHKPPKGCFKKGTILHELLHALGFVHMHGDPNRERYLQIFEENIKESMLDSFMKYSLNIISDFGVGYDYASIMHYSNKAGSVNGKDTILPKKAGVKIGQRDALSEKDVKKLNIMYSCNLN